MGPMPTPNPMPRAAVQRRGTSRAVPVVVSAGLAIGVFCGLLFGLGTGEEVIASPSTGNNVKTEETGEKLPVPPTVGTTAAKTADPTPTPAAGSGSATQVAAAGSASGSAAGSADPAAGSAAPAGSGAGSAATTAAAGSGATAPAAGSAASTPPAAGSAAAPAVAAKIYKVKFKLIPDSLAASAKVTIDGKAIEGTEVDIDVGTAEKKTVKVVVKANGFKSYEKVLTVEGDTEMQVEMTKRPASTPSVGPRPGGGTKKPPSGGGGLIDI
jgi:hypothetical protein